MLICFLRIKYGRNTEHIPVIEPTGKLTLLGEINDGVYRGCQATLKDTRYISYLHRWINRTILLVSKVSKYFVCL